MKQVYSLSTPNITKKGRAVRDSRFSVKPVLPAYHGRVLRIGATEPLFSRTDHLSPLRFSPSS